MAKINSLLKNDCEHLTKITNLIGRKCSFRFIDYCNFYLELDIQERYYKHKGESVEHYRNINCYILDANIFNNLSSTIEITISLLPVDATDAAEVLQFTDHKEMIIGAPEFYINEVESNEDYNKRVHSFYTDNFYDNKELFQINPIEQPEEKGMSGLLNNLKQRKSSGNKSLLGKIMTEIQEEEAPEDLPKARKCKNCYKFFTPPHAKASHQRYCTIKCRSAAQNKRNKRRNKQKNK
jgi:hypothetical protein